MRVGKIENKAWKYNKIKYNTDSRQPGWATAMAVDFLDATNQGDSNM